MAKGIGRNGELFARLVDPAHLIRSATTAAKGKRRKEDVARFLLDLEPECLRLAEELRSGAWTPGAFRTFRVRDPKPRLISAAPFADRVVHHALVSVMEPCFERRFVPCSFACRVGRGTHAALRRAKLLASRHRYVLRGDLVKFFPSLDHDIVKREVRRVVADERFLAVLERVIDGSNEQEPVFAWFPGDDLFTPTEHRRGLPIGNLTSQFLANVVLDRLDHAVMDDAGFGAYVRYCDDLLVFGDDRRLLAALRERLVVVLADLRLKLHERKGGLHRSTATLPFLGFVLRKGRYRLKRASVERATRRLTRRRKAHEAGVLSGADLTASVRAWIAHAAFGATVGLRSQVLRRAGLYAEGLR